jgi:hypothetical protein
MLERQLCQHGRKANYYQYIAVALATSVNTVPQWQKK